MSWRINWSDEIISILVSLIVGSLLFVPISGLAQSEIAVKYYKQGATEFKAGNYSIAAESYGQAWDAELQSANPRIEWLVNMAGYQGIAYYYAGNKSAALYPLQKGIKYATDLRDSDNFAYFNFFLGMSYYILRDYSKAIYFLKTSWETYQSLNDHEKDVTIALISGYGNYKLVSCQSCKVG